MNIYYYVDRLPIYFDLLFIYFHWLEINNNGVYNLIHIVSSHLSIEGNEKTDLHVKNTTFSIPKDNILLIMDQDVKRTIILINSYNLDFRW